MKDSLEFQRDSDLIAKLCKADQHALELLYNLYYNRLFRFIARVTRQESVIEEVINDVMFVVWEKADTYNQQCKPSTWIFGIAYNKARQALRSNRPYDLESYDELTEQSDILGEIDAGLQQLEMDNWLEAAFDQLSADQRAVIELTYFEGLSYGEIALLMDCPENTVKTRMFHARKKLAFILKKDENIETHN